MTSLVLRFLNLVFFGQLLSSFFLTTVVVARNIKWYILFNCLSIYAVEKKRFGELSQKQVFIQKNGRPLLRV